MDEQTRYRVTGSLFLLAVAVICLPMVFDGEGIPSVELEPLPTPAAVAPVEPMDQVAPASDYVERIATLRQQVDDDGFDVATKTRFGEPVLSDPVLDTTAWAVQVASFADQDNARKFRKQLREQGFEAFISTTNSDSEVRHRVAVGPLLNQSDAGAMRVQLSELLNVEARLMAFSS
jgi:DedD protein